MIAKSTGGKIPLGPIQLHLQSDFKRPGAKLADGARVMALTFDDRRD